MWYQVSGDAAAANGGRDPGVVDHQPAVLDAVDELGLVAFHLHVEALAAGVMLHGGKVGHGGSGRVAAEGDVLRHILA